MRSNIVTLTAGLAATASAQCTGNYFSFYNRAGSAASYQRLDPGLFPGVESPHLHSFDGGNGLSASVSYEDLQASTCTTARIKSDKSLYWRPTLFFSKGNSFHRVPEMQTKIYYKFGDGNNWANVTSFPEGLNMVAGIPSKRSDGDNPAGIRWACHGADGGSAIFENGFPKGFGSCSGGFASEVTFPSCWNGEKMDPKNPNAHMAWPNANAGVGIENCPTTHRAARFPTIFIEFWWDVSTFTGQYGANDMPWVLANGDPTGFGFHADFMNGWDAGVLDKAIAESGGCYCGCGCGQSEMEQCFGAENVNDDGDAEWAQCAVTPTYSGGEAEVLSPLPGCNPIQSGPAAATAVTGAGCSAAPAAAVPSDSPASSAAASQTSAVASSAITSDVYSAVFSVVDAASTAVYSIETAAPEAATSSSKSSSRRYRASRTGTSTANALPSLTIDLHNKQAASSGYDAAQPTFAASSSSAAVPAGETGTPSTGDDGEADDGDDEGNNEDDDEDCKAPTYVTVTPTVYVTVGAADVTSCTSAPTIYQTLTETATVTVGAYGAMSSGSY
ncbi:hypothetical protein BDW02DRAFT_103396 [Decorospora gaudefroyi]|uniref:DUF1996 domain-containing protein n=1 Tax=Decorospora gaudefroyi TaxID=184978 RepID=A0A6A5JZF1_9PLEO|nr:hypothetical protein BDW02DRAFT_103396 [Decorospora gaudefroyi]